MSIEMTCVAHADRLNQALGRRVGVGAHRYLLNVLDFASALTGPAVPHAFPDLFGGLIGSWSIRNRSLIDGQWRESDRTWIFARVLGGRAVQDVILLDDGTRAGTTMRTYDQAIAAWRVSWFGVARGNLCHLVARPDGADGILLDGREEGAGAIRWAFSDIEPESFNWNGWFEDAEGWTLEQQMTARRVV